MVKASPQLTRPYTRAEVACGWAGAVMIKSYPSVWAGAVMEKPPVTPKKLTRTDRHTDQQTDRAGCRVACTPLKTGGEGKRRGKKRWSINACNKGMLSFHKWSSLFVKMSQSSTYSTLCLFFLSTLMYSICYLSITHVEGPLIIWKRFSLSANLHNWVKLFSFIFLFKLISAPRRIKVRSAVFSLIDSD